MADTKISAFTDGVTAAATDRLAAARSPFGSGDNRYITPAYIKDYILGLANTWTQTQTFTTETALLRWGSTSGDAAIRGNGAFTECRVGDNSGYGPSRASGYFAMGDGANVLAPVLRTPAYTGGALTIASGVVTVVNSYHAIDTEGAGATDDLDTINGGVDGMILTIRANNDARTVVVKDGTGNIQIAGDMTLDNTQDTITLRYDGTLTAWLEIGRAASGA